MPNTIIVETLKTFLALFIYVFQVVQPKFKEACEKKVHQEMKIGRYSPHVMTDGKIAFKVSSSRSSQFSKPLFFCHEAWRMDFKENGNLIHFQAARLDP